jgi:hypothetical protein
MQVATVPLQELMSWNGPDELAVAVLDHGIAFFAKDPDMVDQHLLDFRNRRRGRWHCFGYCHTKNLPRWQQAARRNQRGFGMDETPDESRFQL